jgi:hypothetical protein
MITINFTFFILAVLVLFMCLVLILFTFQRIFVYKYYDKELDVYYRHKKHYLTKYKMPKNYSQIRADSIDWFNRKTLEEQFYVTIQANELIAGDNTRHPATLTGREVQIIYTYHKLTIKN